MLNKKKIRAGLKMALEPGLNSLEGNRQRCDTDNTANVHRAVYSPYSVSAAFSCATTDGINLCRPSKR